MAEDTRQANVVLTADTNQYSQQMASSAVATNQAADAVNKLFASIERLQRATARRLEIISVTAIGGITAATLAAAKFEQQMGQLQAQAAITKTSIGATTKAVNDLRTSLPVSTEQVIALVGALQKMGTSKGNIKDLADTFIRLGAATGEDIGSLATNLVSLQRAMGTTEGSTRQFADQVAHLSANLGVSATGVLQFANSLAPVARMVGMTQTEVMGFSAAFVKSGQDSAAAANATTKLITDISRATRYGSNDIYAYANAVGMTAEAFKKLPAAEQASQFFNAISRQGAESIKTLERLGYDGPRALKAIQGLAQSGGLNKALSESEAGFHSDATKIGSEKAMDGLNDSLKKLQNTLTSIGQSFGATFLPVITKVVDAVTKLANVVRTALQPFNALLGVMGLAGGAATGVLGAGISGFGALTTAALAYSVLRNPLTAGFRAARAERTGNRPSAFTRRTAESYAAGRGGPLQRWMFRAGAMGGNAMPTGAPPMGPMTRAEAARARVLGSIGGGVRTLPGRLASAGAGIYAGAMGLASSSLDPIRMGAINNAMNRSRSSFSASGTAFRAAASGEGGFRVAVRSVTTATMELGKAIFSATGGITRLGLAVAGSGLKKAGAGLMSLAGGPWGLALMGGIAGFSAYQNVQQSHKDFQTRVTSDAGTDSMVDKYATSMGVAATAAMSFADTVNKASGNINVTDPNVARTISPKDIQAAGVSGRTLTNPDIAKMSVAEATAQATSVYGQNGSDPRIMQGLKLDLLQTFQDPKIVNEIISQASTGTYSPGDMLTGHQRNVGQKDAKWYNLVNPMSDVKTSKEEKDAQAAVVKSTKQLAAQVYVQSGQGESNKVIQSGVNAMLAQIESGDLGVSEKKDMMQSIGGLLGVQNFKVSNSDVNSIGAWGGTGQEVLAGLLKKQGTGAAYLKAYSGMTPAEQAATTYSQQPVGDSDYLRKLGVYRTPAGKMLQGTSSLAGDLKGAMLAPDDANKQLTAATEWGQSLVTMTGNTVQADTELQNLKGAIKDVNDPLYQMATAAQGAVARIQGFRAAGMTQADNIATDRQSLAASIGLSVDNPERQTKINAGLDKYNEDYETVRNQFKQVVTAYRQFNLQQSRAQDDFTRQQERSDEDYNRQRQYGEEDYWQSRQRQQESFDRQRNRSEEDHQHQVEEMIKQNAKTIQDVYQRITTKPTWDAQNLLGNANEQLQQMKQQQADLATIRGLGLSGDAIQQLGLNEFGNQQQLARMVGDLANNPELVKQWNEAVQGKLDISKAFTTDQDSESWKEMERQYQLSLNRMQDDFKIMNDQGEADYKKTLDRQNLAYAESMKRTGEDFRRQMANAREDLNKSFEQVTNDFNTLADEALGSLTGVTAQQYSALKSQLTLSSEDIAKALTGTAEDMVKLLAPLFGGEDAARKALAGSISTFAPGGSNSVRGPNGETGTTPPKGGGYGSEASYDSMSSGGGIGGPGSANFPLPAGSWSKSSNFGMRMNPVLHKMMLHAGTDLAARPGTPIGAAQDGIVTKAQTMGGLGNMVEVSHGDGTKTWYGHMSMITSKVGQVVSAGQQIGLVGSTGNSTGPHLHFERHINGQAVDPWGYLQGLQNGSISPAAAGALGMPSGAPPDVKSMQSVMDAEKAFSNLVPGGLAYTKGLFPTALQNRVNSLTGNTAMDSVGGDPNLGSYYGGSSARLGARGSYARGGVSMGTSSITTIQHIDQGTDYNGGIVVMAQDPEEMGRKLAERQRMKALTRPSRSNG